ncbi:hypothetical protein OG21DRAFT_1516249 [Imleria badia]|nr:hypothetical protein OG21DRAFT_1516249 [Imleria badia]
MSLYTPVFPSLHESSTSRKSPPDNTPEAAPGKQQNYVEFLRDVHLFLSTQSDMLSPPSRPISPLFDRRVQKVRDEIQNVLNATEGETSSGKWTFVSQALKLGCVRGRHWSVPGAGSCAPEQETDWILPEEESEWIEWEKKREENRRLKGKANASQRIGGAASAAPGSQTVNHASLADLTQPFDAARERRPRDVSPTTLRAAKEKVRKWQASVASEAQHDTTNDVSPASSSAVVAVTAAKGKMEKPQRSRTLDFAVVKPAAKMIIGKKGKSPLSHPGVRGGSAPIQSKSSTPSKAADMPEAKTALVGVDETAAEQPPKDSPVKDEAPKIADIPETPYLPPSFPAHLETSTPLPDSVIIIRAKPSPILLLPASSSTPLPSTSENPPDERQFLMADPHAANASSSQLPHPPQINTLEPGKRPRALSVSLDDIPNDPPVTPPAKRLRTLTQNGSTPSSKHSRSRSPSGDLDVVVPRTQDDARGPTLGSASHPYNMDSLGMASGGPSTPGKNDQPPTGADLLGLPEKIPSPTKSVKSYFSAPDSDPADSPVKANLLLESPVSPMLSYAQNPSGFLPQITSTQVRKGSPSVGRTNNGMFGMGYSSQFDVERHVDRVSELLEKDVDFDGWLRDVRTVEASQD